MNNGLQNKSGMTGTVLGIVAGGVTAIVAYVCLEFLRDRRRSEKYGQQSDNTSIKGDRGVTDADVAQYFSEYLRTHPHQARELERVIDSLSQLGACVQRQEHMFASMPHDDPLREMEQSRIRNENKYQYDAHMKADKPVIDRFLDNLTENVKKDKPGDINFAKKLLWYASGYLWSKCDAKINDASKNDVTKQEKQLAR